MNDKAPEAPKVGTHAEATKFLLDIVAKHDPNPRHTHKAVAILGQMNEEDGTAKYEKDKAEREKKEADEKAEKEKADAEKAEDDRIAKENRDAKRREAAQSGEPAKAPAVPEAKK